MAGTEVLQQDPPKVGRRVSLRKPAPQRHQTALPRSRQHAGPRQGQAPLSSTRSAQDRVDAAQSPVPELNPKSQPPMPPIQEPENPIPRPHPRTWLPSSGPNPGPRHRRHAPVSSLLSCAQCRPAGQSRRQQVYRAKVQPAKTRRRPSTGRISAPAAPGPTPPRRSLEAAPGTSLLADCYSGAR